ncbi:MAG: hypothetical protein ACSHWZ_02590 [Sulfitobacter sp.]
MKKTLIAVTGLMFLAACGGGTRYANTATRSGAAYAPTLYATGPIQKACLSQGRKGASRARCGCIQAVADQSLSNGDQRRGAKYFKDPGKLQDVRQSDNVNHERFWKEWKAFGQTAAAMCSSS